MATSIDLVTVTADNVDKLGFFCKMSARGKPGYEQKLRWLKDRFEEGMEMRLLPKPERGFIEFIPGDFAWRAVEKCSNYMVIHCLWVVGKSKGKGFGSALVDEAKRVARKRGFRGIAAVTSTGNWLVDGSMLAHHGFESVDHAEPGFELMVCHFRKPTENPRFSGNWDKKKRKSRNGLVVYRSAQCPYLDDAVLHARDWAEANEKSFKEIEMKSAADVRRLSPTPYGVFAQVLDGELLAYHYLLPKDYARVLKTG